MSKRDQIEFITAWLVVFGLGLLFWFFVGLILWQAM